MSHKLNINRAPLIAPKKVTVGDWESPVGWWEVTTEGDCEGRSIRQLGTHYGHVAEIAFALADECSYALNFRKTTPMGSEERRVYDATGKKVNVCFRNEKNRTIITKWMDTDEVKVNESNYYGAVELELLG